MDHQAIKQLLPAYVDEELGIAETLVIDRHLVDCLDCQHDCMEQRSVRDLVKRHVGQTHAPVHLAERIYTALAIERAPPPARPRRAAWLSIGLAMASLCVAALGSGYYLGLSSASKPVSEEIVSSHIRSLQVDHLVDVASSDQHAVKPWFNGKLDFSPPVTDLAAQGFALTGGRLDFLAGRQVAVLVYRHDRHFINLYAWPGDDPDAPLRMQQERGYHLVRWTAGKMHYWAISDLAPAELKVFAATLRAGS